MSALRVGAGHVDITPARPVELGGFVARVQPSIGVHDPVYAGALYIESDSGPPVLWLHADCVGFDATFADRVRSDVHTLLGVPPEQVVLTATHTHSAPSTITLTLTGQQDPDYMAWIETRLVAAARTAAATLEPCRVLSATGSYPLGVERRGDVTARVDHTVTVTALERVHGDGYKALVANYAVHNVAMGHQNRLVSGDIFGHAAERLRSDLPGSPLCLLLPGASGNINPPRVDNDFALPAQWGSELAATVQSALRGAEQQEPTVTVHHRNVPIELERVEGETLSRRADGIRRALEDRDDYASRRFCDAVSIWECRMQERPQQACAEVEIHGVRLGRTVYALVGAELFSHMSAWVPAVCAVGCAAGVVGYLAPRSAYERGGYEVESAFVFYDTQPILPGGFERVAEAVAQLPAALGTEG